MEPDGREPFSRHPAWDAEHVKALGESQGACSLPEQLADILDGAPAFRLDPAPRDAWEYLRALFAVLSDHDVAADAFMDEAEALSIGVQIGHALAARR